MHRQSSLVQSFSLSPTHHEQWTGRRRRWVLGTTAIVAMERFLLLSHFHDITKSCSMAGRCGQRPRFTLTWHRPREWPTVEATGSTMRPFWIFIVPDDDDVDWRAVEMAIVAAETISSGNTDEISTQCRHAGFGRSIGRRPARWRQGGDQELADFSARRKRLMKNRVPSSSNTLSFQVTSDASISDHSNA
jgi:hypothetical protein